MFDWCHFLKIGNCSAENVLEIVIHEYIISFSIRFPPFFSFLPFFTHLFSSSIFTLSLPFTRLISLSLPFYFHSQLIDWNQSNWTEHNNSFYCNGYDCASNDLIKQCKAVSMPTSVCFFCVCVLIKTAWLIEIDVQTQNNWLFATSALSLYLSL